MSKVELSTDYWDCECERNFIQPNSCDKCLVCGALRKEQPDSHQNEVNAGLNFAECREKRRSENDSNKQISSVD